MLNETRRTHGRQLWRGLRRRPSIRRLLSFPKVNYKLIILIQLCNQVFLIIKEPVRIIAVCCSSRMVPSDLVIPSCRWLFISSSTDHRTPWAGPGMVPIPWSCFGSRWLVGVLTWSWWSCPSTIQASRRNSTPIFTPSMLPKLCRESWLFRVFTIRSMMPNICATSKSDECFCDTTIS